MVNVREKDCAQMSLDYPTWDGEDATELPHWQVWFR